MMLCFECSMSSQAHVFELLVPSWGCFSETLWLEPLTWGLAGRSMQAPRKDLEGYIPALPPARTLDILVPYNVNKMHHKPPLLWTESLQTLQSLWPHLHDGWDFHKTQKYPSTTCLCTSTFSSLAVLPVNEDTRALLWKSHVAIGYAHRLWIL